MKTFETEKHNIPKGATHTYELVGDTVGFYRFINGEWHFWSHSNQSWYHVVGNECAHRAKPIAQDNLATQTPEEKEALDLIDTTPHQYEMSKFSGNKWNGEGLPPVGCMVKTENGIAKVVSTSTDEGGIVTYSWNDGANIACAWNNESWINPIKKPESPQQREERERLEAAYDLYCEHDIFERSPIMSEFTSDTVRVEQWLRVVDKTNYRKESN